MMYDPFARGPFPVGVRTLIVQDRARDNRRLVTEAWYPAGEQDAGQDMADASQDTYRVLSGWPLLRQAAIRNAAPRVDVYPFLVFSHASWSHRRQSTFLMTHLASHGYVVAAVDHLGNTMRDRSTWQVTAEGAAAKRSADGLEAFTTHRVLDVQVVLNHFLSGAARHLTGHIDPGRIGVAGHCLGGWTALAASAADCRIQAVLTLAPAGSLDAVLNASEVAPLLLSSDLVSRFQTHGVAIQVR